jgi:hypothetical protein
MAHCCETGLTSQRVVLSIVVPMYNESENVGPFYERLKKVLDQIGESYEIKCKDH